MSALDYFKDVVFNKYVQFNGRASRSEFWYFVLVQFLIQILLIGLGMGLEIAAFLWAYIVMSVVLFLPGIAVSVRRLHDIDKSGAYLLLSFVPLIGTIILLVFYIREGDSGSNQYGPSPYGEEWEDDLFDNFVSED